MDGNLINCMGMAMENILGRPGSAISRSSDDFVPDAPDGFAEHLIQNLYNAPYHGYFYYCDWDMFWTCHADGEKHAALRAVSGGPIYCSDRVGETKTQVLEPLAYRDGRILRMERSGLPADQYCCYDWQAGTGHREGSDFELEKDGYRIYLLLPFCGDAAVVGLADKYMGMLALESLRQLENGFLACVHESGSFAFCTARKVAGLTVNGRDRLKDMRRKGCRR